MIEQRTKGMSGDPDPEVRQRASNWSVAIGLQDVDHLSVSQFLIDTAKRNIRGEITQAEVERLIEEYHSKGRETSRTRFRPHHNPIVYAPAKTE